MRSVLFKTLLLTSFSCLLRAQAYSPIFNLDGWDAQQLSNSGITIIAWKHDQIGEYPPQKWVKIAYDTSKLQGDQNVLMTLSVTASNGETVCCFRAERNKGDPAKMTIIFAVPDGSIGDSSVEILVPDLLAESVKHDIGAPGFGGFRLRLKRILELAYPKETGAART